MPSLPSAASTPGAVAPARDLEPASIGGTAALAAGLAMLVAGALVWGTGGFRVTPLGVVVSVRSPWPLLLFGIVVLASWWWRRRNDAAADARALETLIVRRAAACALTLSLATLAAGTTFGSIVAGGADSSGYLAQAALWRRGLLVVQEPANSESPAPSAAWIRSPLGFRPGRTPGTLVPSYPPGLPVQLAVAGTFGESAIALVVPTLGAAAVYLVFSLGSWMAGPVAGLVAAAFLATSPTFLYQLVQPMSDVPVTTWWLAAFGLIVVRTRRMRLMAGAAAGIALATRPNLAPVLLVALAALWWPEAQPDSARAHGLERVKGLAWFLVGATPAVALLAWFNTTLYGAPWNSGYGEATQLFAGSNVAANLRLYGGWLVDTHLVALLSALAGVLLALWRPSGQRERWMSKVLVSVALVVGLCYVAYAPFESWTYLRFLLPAIAVLCLFTGLAWTRLTSSLPAHARLVLLTTLSAVVIGQSVGFARAEGAFELATREQRYRLVAEWVRDHTPPIAVVACVQHSGSIHYAAGRSVLRWDMATPDDLRSAGDVAGPQRTRVVAPLVIVLDADEEPAFRARFTDAVSFGALDWPPRATTMAPASARVYVVGDREPYRDGERIPTEVLTSSR